MDEFPDPGPPPAPGPQRPDLGGLPPPEQPPSASSRRPRWWRKPWAVWGIIGGFVFGIVPGVFALLSFLKWQRGERATPRFASFWGWVSLVVLALAVVGGTSEVLHPRWADDFSDPSSGWPMGDWSSGSLRYDGGSYRVEAFEARTPQAGSLIVSFSAQTVEVAIDAWLDPGSPNPGALGVSCEQGDGTHFVMVITPDSGDWGIVRFQHGSVNDLASGTSDVIKSGSAVNHLDGVCRQDASGRVSLTFSVNGQRVGSAEDDVPVSAFNAFGAVVGPQDRAPVVGRFDNAVMKRG